MKKLVILGLLLSLMLIILVGCGSKLIYNMNESLAGNNNENNAGSGIANTTSPPNALLPQFMLDDTIYYLSGKNSLVLDIDESGITGRISSAVPLSQKPTENGQANFCVTGTPYVKYNDGYIVLWSDGGSKAEYTGKNDIWKEFISERDFSSEVDFAEKQAIIMGFIRELSIVSEEYAFLLDAVPRFGYELYDNDFNEITASLYYLDISDRELGGYVILNTEDTVIEFAEGRPFYDLYAHTSAVIRSGDKTALGRNTLDNVEPDTEFLNGLHEKLLERWNGEYPDYYGGAYIEGFFLNILVTCEPRLAEYEILQATGESGVIVRKAKHSYSQLEQVHAALSQAISEITQSESKLNNAFLGYGIDVILNKVMVEVYEDEIKKVYSIKGSLIDGDREIIDSAHEKIFGELSQFNPMLNEDFIVIVIKDTLYQPMSH